MWNTTQLEREAVARYLADRNGHTVAKVWPLVTGLWYEYETDDGHYVKVPDFVAKQVLAL